MGLIASTNAAASSPSVKPSARSSASVGVANNRIVDAVMPEVPGFEESDFDMEIRAPKRQANILIFGHDGMGKTSFVTRFAPDPIAFFNFDNRSEQAIYEARQKGRRILPCHVDFPANITKVDDVTARKIGQAAVDKVVRNLDIAVEQSKKGNVRTICLDTGTEFAEILTIAVTGRADGVKGDYGKSKNIINRQLWALYERAREGNAHLVVIARAKAVWENNEPSGEDTYRGPEVLSAAADWSAQIRVKKMRAAAGQPARKRFELKIAKGGVNIEELGNVYTEDEWNDLGGPFAYASMLQFPGTSIEDWQ